jgi:hypothetical protein
MYREPLKYRCFRHFGVSLYSETLARVASVDCRRNARNVPRAESTYCISSVSSGLTVTFCNDARYRHFVDYRAPSISTRVRRAVNLLCFLGFFKIDVDILSTRAPSTPIIFLLT